ncbi:membrane-spanning 4-domains subfamily A member 4A-like isoform X5 [Monodelphis domestica]|uniref:membrane-spanning 4-domains subfamily A member 4A-like isoform X5 n=1 Tax=Monodelphis domestica TaxID=13616 RepID=UPI0007B3FCC6|nr:membrane-spanning 4-domains subfamily A member 4A-like isoform X5 [Monodelphis domestica]
MNSNIMESKPRPKEKIKRLLNPCHRGRLKMATAYKSQAFMLSLLKGDPKMMGVLQVLIGLIVTILGAFLFSNKTELPKSSFSHFFITRYPFWTGACYAIIGVFTILNGVNYKNQDRLSLYMDVLGALISASGISVLFYSLSLHQFVHPASGGMGAMVEPLLHFHLTSIYDK